MRNFILFISLLLTYLGHTQKGTFTIGGGGSFMVSDLKSPDDVEGYRGCCNKTDLKGVTYFNYESNYQSSFLVFSKPDIDFLPAIEIGYNALDKLKLTSSIFGFKRRTKFVAGRFIYPDHHENYRLRYHEEAIRLGLTIGVNYDCLKKQGKHSLLLGIQTSFDKVIQREIIEDYGAFSNNTPFQEANYKASEILPPYTGVNYILFSTLAYQYRISERWLIKVGIRYSPRLKFTRNYYLERDTGIRMIYSSILAFDLQLVYKFGEGKGK